MKTIYVQEKGGQKLHLAFKNGDEVSQPLCGRTVEKYRMTINVPLAHACLNCIRLSKNTFRMKKVYNEFLDSCKI